MDYITYFLPSLPLSPFSPFFLPSLPPALHFSLSVLQVHFWLVLATDGVNTQAVYIYVCNGIFFSHVDVYTFIYNQTAVGYRLDTINYNDTCISSQIPDLFRCSLPRVGGCDNIYYDGIHNLVETVFYNLTNMCE